HPDLKQTDIRKIEISIPDTGNRERYLAYLINRFQKVEGKKVLYSGKTDILNACREFELSLRDIERLLEKAVHREVKFDSVFIKSDMNSGAAGIRSLDEIPSEEFLACHTKIKSRIIGQNEAVDKTFEAVLKARELSTNIDRPVGCFFLVGPTATGKSELMKILARIVFGTEKALISIHCETYKYNDDIKKLTGSPYGYIGWDPEGGWLTKQVKKRRRGVILFEEIEKGHDQLQDFLLHILDEGEFEDGCTVDKINVREFLVAVTSNLGTSESMGISDPHHKEQVIKEAVKDYLKPEIYNRFDDFIVFKSLSVSNCCRIADILLRERLNRVEGKKRLKITYSDTLIEEIVSQGYDPELNARPLKRKIDEMVMTPLAYYFIGKKENRGEKLLLDFRDKELVIQSQDTQPPKQQVEMQGRG
ncbi:AAA family ATPase, partial [bacterium]|nr:AAA family ATPase [bacterium]